MLEMINFIGIKKKIGENIKEKYAYLVTIVTAINCDQQMTNFISRTQPLSFLYNLAV